MECLWQCFCFDRFSGFILIHFLFGIFFAIIFHLAGKCNQHIKVSISLLLDLAFKFK